MSFMWTATSLVIALVVVRISHWLYLWSNPNSNCIGKLPPGTSGLPVIGETVEFFKPHGFYEIPPFFKKRLLRYGPLFRTNIFGSNTVFSTDQDVIFEIFKQDNKTLTLGYPEMFAKVMGKDNLFFKPGDIHKHIKDFTLHLLGVESLKTKMMGKMDQDIRDHLRLKASEGRFDVTDAVSNMVVATMTPMVISNLEPETQTKLMDNFKSFSIHDWFQSPLAFSTWKTFYKVLKARREVIQVIKDALARRKESKEKHGDFIDTVLEELEKNNNIFDEGSAISLIFSILVIPRETVNDATSMAVKFLTENPKVLAELKREHEAILQKRGDKEGQVSWEEYRHNMSFTNMVINESLRLASMAPVLFRKALKDVNIKGYTIPAGWIVAVAPSLVHFNEEIYENPFEFNPWRWEGKEMVWGSKSFMVFGGGVRLCAGAEFSRLHMALFLHHLVTTYDFSLVQDCELIRTPILHFAKGLPINISKSSK